MGCPGPIDGGGRPRGLGAGHRVHRGGGRGWVLLGCIGLVFGQGGGWVPVVVLPGHRCQGAGM